MSVDLPQGVGNDHAAAEVVTLATLRLRFFSANEHQERTKGTSQRRPIFGRPTEIRPARTARRLRLSIVLSGLAKSRVQPVLFYFEVEGALRNPEVFGHRRQIAVAEPDRCADGITLDGVKIRNGRGLR